MNTELGVIHCLSQKEEMEKTLHFPTSGTNGTLRCMCLEQIILFTRDDRIDDPIVERLQHDLGCYSIFFF